MPHLTCARIPIPWPAVSGRGVKVPDDFAGTQGDNLNFFDPARVEFTPNEVYFAFRRAFIPMPPVRATRFPEAIVVAPGADPAMPVLAERRGCPELVGVLPDTEGRAWFELPEAGPVTFLRTDGETAVSKEISAGYKRLVQPPGFDSIERVELSR